MGQVMVGAEVGATEGVTLGVREGVVLGRNEAEQM